MSEFSISVDALVTKRARRALRLKEWVEHRWRFALGVIVLSVLLGGMLRAQVIPYSEAAIFVFWPVGTILTIFIATGAVATERSGRTWEFLLAQPVPRFQILLAKWRTGLCQLAAMNAIAGLVGFLAMWSRHFYGRTSVWTWMLYERSGSLTEAGKWTDITRWTQMISDYPGFWLVVLVMAATISLACWYTVLFFVLTRARNEFAAALGGLLLTIAAHVWLAQWTLPWGFRVPLLLNPFATFGLIVFSPEKMILLPAMLIVQSMFWIGGTLLIARRVFRGQSHV